MSSNTSVVPKSNTLDLPSGKFKLSSPDNMSFKVIKTEGNRYIAGYANVADIVDSQNDIMPVHVLKEAWEKWKSNPEFCILSLLHSNIPLAKVVFDPVQDSDGTLYRSGVDERGLYIVAKVRDDVKIANDAWQKIESGELRGFSIGGQNVIPPVKECKDGICRKIPQKIELHEVGIVTRPANRVSLFTVLKDDSLLRLSEESNKIHDMIFRESIVKVSKVPDIEGKYHIFVDSKEDCPMKNMVSMEIEQFCINAKIDSFKVVKEMDSTVDWIPLFDLALLRPFTIKGDESLTEDSGTVASTLSPTDKPIVSELTMSEKKDEKKEGMSTKQTVDPIQVKPEEVKSETLVPVEKPVEAIAPLTLETLAADIASIKEQIGKLAKANEDLEKAKYPWDQCISDRLADGYSQERAEKICGAIKAGTIRHSATKEDMDKFIESEIAKTDIKKAETPKVEPLPEVKVEVKPVEVKLPEVKVVEQPTIVQPVTPPVEVAPVVEPIEPKIVQRGKSVSHEEPKAELDLLGIYKMKWSDMPKRRMV